MSVDTTTPTYRDVVKQTIQTAQIVPQTIDLRFQVNGIFGQYYADIGEEVSKGELLASLDTTSLERDLSRLINHRNTARFRYITQQDEYLARLLELRVTLESIQKQEIQGNELAVKKQIEIALEQQNLSQKLMDLELKELENQISKLKEATYHQYMIAPCDGVVVGLTNFWEQNSVGTDTIAVTLAIDEKPYLSCEFLSETKLNDCVEYYALVGGKRYNISYVPPEKSAGTSKKSATTKFEFAPEETSIAIGDSAILVMVEQKVVNVLTVPADVVYEDTSGEYVYIVDNDSRIRRNIETGLSDSYGIEVKSGLQEGDNVYVKN